MAFDLSHLSREEQDAILDGPALRAPPGVEPNFENPPNQNLIPQIVIPICLTLVTAVVLLRIYSKTFLRKPVHLDDFLAVLAYVGYIGYIYCVYDVTNSIGFFVHQYHVIGRDIMPVQRILQIAVNFYVVSLMMSKVAIVLQWIQIFAPKGTRGVFYWVCQVTIWVTILFYLTSGIAGNLICLPFERIWDKRVPGYCWSGRTLNFTVGTFNLFLDVVLLVLPQRAIWSLNMPLQRKIGIAIIFAIGLAACGAAAVRVGVTFGYMNDPDWLYRVAGLSMSCIGEMTCLLLVYCMPSIPATFRDSALLSGILRSFQSSLRSLTRQEPGTSSGSSGSKYKDQSNSRSQKGYREMGLSEIPMGRVNREHESDSIVKLEPQRTQEV